VTGARKVSPLLQATRYRVLGQRRVDHEVTGSPAFDTISKTPNTLTLWKFISSRRGNLGSMHRRRRVGVPSDDLVKSVLAGYLEEVERVRHVLDCRNDEVQRGQVQPMDGKASVQHRRERERALINERSRG
jgi:hypothetical protein